MVWPVRICASPMRVEHCRGNLSWRQSAKVARFQPTGRELAMYPDVASRPRILVASVFDTQSAQNGCGSANTQPLRFGARPSLPVQAEVTQIKTGKADQHEAIGRTARTLTRNKRASFCRREWNYGASGDAITDIGAVRSLPTMPSDRVVAALARPTAVPLLS